MTKTPADLKNYVIPCQLVGSSGMVQGTVIKISHTHVLVDTGPQLLHTHAVFQVKIDLPEEKIKIDAQGMIIKTRDEWKSKASTPPQPGIHLVEVVLKNLPSDQARGLAYLAVKMSYGV